MARTRSKEAHGKVLTAALDLIAERGVEGTSMDAIASVSGVSKATLYKHWANKDALLIDVLRNSAGELPPFDSGDPRADMVGLLRYLAEDRKSQDLAQIWRRVISYAISNPEFAKALQVYSFAPRRKQIARLLKQAAAQGELRRGIDPDFAMDLLIGPIVHRRFVNSNKIPSDLADRLVEYFWHWGKPQQ